VLGACGRPNQQLLLIKAVEHITFTAPLHQGVPTFAGLADLTLFHFEPHITPHVQSVPPELRFGKHPLESCVSLLMSVGGQRDGQESILVDLHGVPVLTEQPELGASLSQPFFTGSPTLLLGLVYFGYHSRRVS